MDACEVEDEGCVNERLVGLQNDQFSFVLLSALVAECSLPSELFDFPTDFLAVSTAAWADVTVDGLKTWCDAVATRHNN